ncbi:hypothetical protein L6452_25880 [Arctium lappa]|uniref:Uncharacterized protein n=1 Tax=Arctium lappa TaxID=4217 RepID=A0ACB9AAZ7_ARCLA|nr:hypothetical protein L6452_25880 [Arctium lappa]
MEKAGDVDPFASLIIPNCQPTASQENKLQACPFARESEVFSGGLQLSSSPEEASEQTTGIIMLSLPESSDDYQTPPEQQFYSQNSSNDGQLPATKTAAVDREMESGGVGSGETMVVDDDFERQGQRVIDLSNESDNLGFSEKSPRLHLEDNDTLMIDGNDTHSVDGNDTHLVDEIDAENSVTEAREMELSSSPKENAHEVFVEMPPREKEASISPSTVNTTSNRGKRRLPLSVNGRDQNNGEKGDYCRHEAFRNALDRVLKMLVGEPKDDCHDEDIDFLKTAKRRGMTFPRPRWWPPEGGLQD